MAIQYSATHRTNAVTDISTQAGVNAVIKLFSGTAPTSVALADTGTLLVQFAGNAGGFATANPVLTGVSITGTAGQFACSASPVPLAVGMQIIISGTLGGTGTITGYATPTSYWVTATNASTTFTLSATPAGAGVTTTAGTPTGLTYTTQGTIATQAVAAVNAAASGTPGYFRVYPSAATTTNAVMQGTVGTTGTDMILTAATVTAAQSVSFTSMAVTAFGV